MSNTTLRRRPHRIRSSRRNSPGGSAPTRSSAGSRPKVKALGDDLEMAPPKPELPYVWRGDEDGEAQAPKPRRVSVPEEHLAKVDARQIPDIVLAVNRTGMTNHVMSPWPVCRSSSFVFLL